MWQIATFGVKVICFIVNSEILNGCWKFSKKPQSIKNLHLHCIYCHSDLMCYKNLYLWENIKQRTYCFNRTTCISVEINRKKHWKTKTMFREIHEQTSLNISCNFTPNSLTLSLPQVTKREVLLTISIQYQAGRWWE